MCGIAGFYLKDSSLRVDLDELLSSLLTAIDHRGGDATGFVALGSDGIMEWQKAACDVRDFNWNRRKVPQGTTTLLAHTRWATQGLPAFIENNHPIRRGAFFIVHNGHVFNDNELFKSSGKLPYGKVDSEAIAALLSHKGSLTALPEVMEAIEGQAAVAALDERENALALARGSASPLYVLETKRIVLFGSTEWTVLNSYRKHIGSIPSKRAVEVPEGTFLHFQGQETSRSQFAFYSPPPKKTWVPSALPERKEEQTPTKPLSFLTESDYLECDGCGSVTNWKELSYELDHTGLTWALCDVCQPFFNPVGAWETEQQAKEEEAEWTALEEEEEQTGEWEYVNKAILAVMEQSDS